MLAAKLARQLTHRLCLIADGGRGTRRSKGRAAICVLFACTVAIGCQEALPEPGSLPATLSPLFKGFESYQTLDQASKVLPDRAAWKVVFQNKSQSRAGCPRFDEFTFAVPATDLGYSGIMKLQFINDKLATTVFTPTDFSGYVEALQRAGTTVSTEERRVPPATLVWSSNGVDGRPFVGWRDERFAVEVNAWVGRCC